MNADKDIFGRDIELEILNKLISSKKAEFLAIYGRRRVGKTFLVRSACKGCKNYLEVTGKKKASNKEHLKIFAKAFSAKFLSNTEISLNSWEAAFDLVYNQAEKNKEPFILFLDEFPWMVGKRSGLLETLDQYWNAHFSKLDNFKLVICGSASAWILKKIIHAKGGLHNRLTRILALEAFNLAKTKDYLLKKKQIVLSRDQLLELYLCIGGIPYYLDWVEAGLSASQVIQDLCFSANGILYKEFDSLFASLFEEDSGHQKIVEILAPRRYGLTRKEILKLVELSNGGGASKVLQELEASGFIKSYIPFAGSSRDKYYRLTDAYTLFYLNWIAKAKESGVRFPKDYWLLESGSQKFKIWSGYSFETVCFNHLDEILQALRIAGMKILPSTWRSQNQNGQNAQVDLVLERADRIVTLCEIKYNSAGISFNQKLKNEILKKQAIFKESTQTKFSVNSALISAGGILEKFQPQSGIVALVTTEDLI